MINYRKFYSCCFIGHRVVENKEIREPLKEIVLDLIEKSQVRTFYFGSKSEFNDMCYNVVSELNQKYKDIQRIGVTCKSETVVLVENKEKMQRAVDAVLGVGVKKVLPYEGELKLDSVMNAGRLSYVKRNEEMINLSDFCVFYLNKDYIRQRKNTSGTKLAHEYAKQKKKNIIVIQ